MFQSKSAPLKQAKSLPNLKRKATKEKMATLFRPKLDTIPALQNAVAFTPTGDEVHLNQFWRSKTVVLKILARLGCSLCKYEARCLAEIAPVLHAHNAVLVAVAFEDLNLQEFLNASYWNWEILIDPNKQIYQAAGLTRLTVSQFLGDIMGTRIFKIVHRLFKQGISNPVGGDPRQLGGTFVISPGGELKYVFRPNHLAMFPSIKDICRAVGADPDLVDEDELDPYICPLVSA